MGPLQPQQVVATVQCRAQHGISFCQYPERPFEQFRTHVRQVGTDQQHAIVTGVEGLLKGPVHALTEVIPLLVVPGGIGQPDLGNDSPIGQEAQRPGARARHGLGGDVQQLAIHGQGTLLPHVGGQAGLHPAHDRSPQEEHHGAVHATSPWQLLPAPAVQP